MKASVGNSQSASKRRKLSKKDEEDEEEAREEREEEEGEPIQSVVPLELTTSVMVHEVAAPPMKDRRRARYTSVVRVLMEGLRKHRGSNSMLTEDMLNMVLSDLKKEYCGSTNMDQLKTSLDDIKTIAVRAKDMPEEEFDELFDYTKQLQDYACLMTKDHSKVKKQAEVDVVPSSECQGSTKKNKNNGGNKKRQVAPPTESFTDRLRAFNKAEAEAKDKIALMVGLGAETKKDKDKRDFCLKWIGNENILHMTLGDLEDFPNYMRTMLTMISQKSRDGAPVVHDVGGVSTSQVSAEFSADFQKRVSAILESSPQLNVVYKVIADKIDGNPHTNFKTCLKDFFAAKLA